ncbi:MAG TPA: NAD(P)-dependent oxidoreductase [Pirellulales bacterium]|nr:NAD(P)-dependent oxidoreductase [Pirellulales bacterium]
MLFRVGITQDFLKPDGTLGFGDIGLDLLSNAAGIEWEFLAESCQEIPPGVADAYDALLVLAPRVTARSLDGCRRLSLVARFGVGYDNVDVEACTRNEVILSITPEGVRRPVATSALALLLALSHKLLIKDRLTRTGRWAEKLDHMGTGLTGRTLGLIGLGNIGRELFRLAAPFEMRHVGFDPYFPSDAAAAAGIEWQPLDRVLAESDFVVVCCALTPETHHLLDASRLRLLKPTAYLINVARGPIIDQTALTDVLRRRAIAGAALDVFETEPIAADDPLLQLDNVIVSPHAICWTDELFLANGRVACRHILDVAAGLVPTSVVNAQVLEHAAMHDKLTRYARAGA